MKYSKSSQKHQSSLSYLLSMQRSLSTLSTRITHLRSLGSTNSTMLLKKWVQILKLYEESWCLILGSETPIPTHTIKDIEDMGVSASRKTRKPLQKRVSSH